MDASQIQMNINMVAGQLDNLIAQALEKSLQTVENESKRICPVDDGILRGSISHAVNDDKNGIVFTNQEYAVYVHEGTGIHASGGNGRMTPWVYRSADGKYHRTSGQKAQPFMKEAVNRKRGEIIQIFKDTCGVQNITIGGI